MDQTSPTVSAEYQRRTMMALPVHGLLPKANSVMITHIMNDTRKSIVVRTKCHWQQVVLLL